MSILDEAVLEELIEQAGLAAIYRRDHAAAKQQLADADKAIATYIRRVQEQGEQIAERDEQIDQLRRALDALRGAAQSFVWNYKNKKVAEFYQKELNVAIIHADTFFDPPF